MPGESSGISKWPTLLLTTVRATPVAVFVAVTVTPGRAPPLMSVALPEIEPVMLCANAASGMRIASNTKRARARKRGFFAWFIWTPCELVGGKKSHLLDEAENSTAKGKKDGDRDRKSSDR